MTFEMPFDLPLGLGDEAEAGAVADKAGERADGERAGIPERIQQAGAGAELLEAGLAPGEVIGLLAGRLRASAARVVELRATKAWP